MVINRFKTVEGLTLTELLISSVIVIIVMMGVVSIDSVVAKKRQIGAADNLLSLSMRALIEHMQKNVIQATGYGTDEHTGILIGAQLGDLIPNGGAGTFCIDQDISPMAKEYNVTPTAHNDDRWACYTFNPADHNIYFCERPYDAASAYRGAGRCSMGEVVGQAVSWAPSFEMSDTAGSVKMIFALTITSRYDPAKAKSTLNPESTFTFSSSPPGHAIR